MKNKSTLFAAQILILLSLNVFAQNPKCPNAVPITNDPAYNAIKASASLNYLPRYALDSISAYCAWSITTGDPDILVAVIDTEFDTTHEDMKNTFESIVGIRRHPESHGTGTSSLVASGTNNGKGMAGIGYNTRVRGYHAADKCLSRDNDCVWNGVKSAYQDGIKIISVSASRLDGYEYDTYWNNLYLQQMLNDGVVLIVAAGNDSTSKEHQAYADIPGVINVSSVNRNNLNRPTNNARNAWVDVCATSSHIVAAKRSDDTTAPKDPFCVGSAFTGWYCLGAAGPKVYTSQAAPQVAGTVALMRSVNSFLPSDSIEHIIKTTGDHILDDTLFKGRTSTNPPPRRVNAYKAVKEAKRRACGRTDTFSKLITKNTLNQSVNGGNIIISNTSIASGKRLSVRACNSVTINGPFLVEAGAALNINVVP